MREVWLSSNRFYCFDHVDKDTKKQLLQSSAKTEMLLSYARLAKSVKSKLIDR